MERLTEKQKQFIDYYVETGNQMESARLAGYKQPQVQGHQNLEKLRKHIDAKLKAKDDARIASQDEVLRFLTSVMRNEETEEIPILCGKGNQRIVDKRLSAKDRIRAAELLGKRYGVWIEKQITETIEDDRFIEALNAKADDLAWDDDNVEDE